MGAGCCKNIPEFNPDGSPKEPQTKEQKKDDPLELRRAARSADWQQMRMLLRRMPLADICSGASKDEGGEEELGYTALHYSVSINHLRGVRKLLRYGLPPGTPNRAGRTPLHAALEGGKLKAARLLLERAVAARRAAAAAEGGAAKAGPHLINQQDAGGVSALLAVAASGRLRLAREVLAICRDLDMPVDWDTRDKQGNSLLLYAAKWGWWEELGAWAERGSDAARLLNTQNKQGETVLGHVLLFAASGLLPAARSGPLVAKLLAAGALPTLPAFAERVPLLCLAAAADDMASYLALAEKGANPLACRDALGRGPLHYAGARGACTTAGELLAKGLKPYAPDGQGNTPLHLAAMRGQGPAVALLLERADDPVKALLAPNKDGLAPYHLALKAGPGEAAQAASLRCVERLGEGAGTPVRGRKGAVADTPLMLAIAGHQDRVVKALLAKGQSPNEPNARGELPLARVLAAATAPTYAHDAAAFDALLEAGADMSAASESAHPLLAVCRNNLSNFAERAVRVLTARCGALDWNKRDAKGYTPLALAAFHDNAWLVRHLIDEVGVDPNDPAQATTRTEPEVVGSTGALCWAKPLTQAGTVEGQTPLMCAAKGASEVAVQLLLNRGARVDAVDAAGRTPLQHALHMDKAASLRVAAALLQMGAPPGRGTQAEGGAWRECVDVLGEGWPHRAVRYGCAEFLYVWATSGGCMEQLATTAEDADDPPGAELAAEEKGDFLDFAGVGRLPGSGADEEDEELVDEYNGEDSEKAGEGEDGEGDGAAVAPKAPGAVAEGVEGGGGSDSDDDCGPDSELAALIAEGRVESHYAGPTPNMLLRWRRRGAKWWDEFWVTRGSLPDSELEGDPDWADRYAMCEEGDEWIDEEDVEEEIWEAVRAEQRAAAAAARAHQAATAAAEDQPAAASAAGPHGGVSSPGGGFGGSPGAGGRPPLGPHGSPGPVPASLIQRVSSGLAHKLFRRRLPNAAVEDVEVDGGGFAAGSPSQWLRRRSTSSLGGAPTGPTAPGGGSGAGSPAAGSGAASPLTHGSPLPSRGPSQRSGQRRASAGPGPVAEAREDDPMTMRLLDADEEPSDAPAAAAAAAEEPAAGGGGGGAGLKPLASLGRGLRGAAGQLTAGVKGEKLWANEPYYQPATRFEGLPRYMDEGDYDIHDVPLRSPRPANTPALKKYQERPQEHYEKQVSDFLARVQALPLPAEPMMEGPELRARNIAWYNNSLSPTEYPLKPGKWKSLAKLAKKAAEEARQRRPRKAGEKPKVRSKKAWFGLPDLPSRPELSLTSPLVLAVRLGRVGCVKALLSLSTVLPHLPDGHGVSPLSYAMLLLAKERHSKPCAAMVDLLLAARPLVDTAVSWRLTLLPRLQADLKAAEAAMLVQGGEEKAGRRARKALQQKRDTLAYLTEGYHARDFPSVMEPLVLAALMNDTARAAVLVHHCGANPNNAFVWLPDIPTYFRGMWEKQVGRTKAVVSPLHVAICQRKYASVRAFLDLGSDPNAAGMEFSGDTRKDLARRAKLARDKAKEGKALREAACNANPYAKLWAEASSSLKMMLLGAKRFIASIEIPGLSRPHPWVSPLHLACRFGAAEIVYMLLKRKAAVNGGAAAAFAPKSPLEEALSYARANAQAYGTTSERFNYNEILERASLEVVPGAQATMDACLAEHKAKLAEFEAAILAKASKLASSMPVGKDGKAKTPEMVMAKARATAFVGGVLAEFTPEKLAALPIPSMNPVAAASKGAKMMKDALAMMDPVKGAIKAVALAAKIIVKIYLEMVKRPIALYDPALAAAHVVLRYRAPINLGEKQTAILMRDILDNGNLLPGGDHKLSYYRWLGLEISKGTGSGAGNDQEADTTKDEAWVQLVVAKIGVLKSNLKYGYMNLDMTTNFSEYERNHKKFMTAVHSAILNTGTASIMPAYLHEVLAAGLSAEEKAKLKESEGAGAVVQALLKAYIGSTAAKQDELVKKYAALTQEEAKEDWVNRVNFGEVPQPADRDAIARDLLPTWIYAAPAEAAAGGAAPADAAPPQTEAAVVEFISTKFTQPNTVPPEFAAPPGLEAKNPFMQMINDASGIDFSWPEVTAEELAAVRPTLADLTDADICKAVVRAFNAKLAEDAAAHSLALRAAAERRAKAAVPAAVAALTKAAEGRGALVKKSCEARSGGAHFDEDALFRRAMEDPAWEAAAAVLGGGPEARALLDTLRAAAAAGGEGGAPLPLPDPLEFATKLGRQAMEMEPAELVAAVEAALGAPLGPGLRRGLEQAIPAARAAAAAAGNDAAGAAQGGGGNPQQAAAAAEEGGAEGGGEAPDPKTDPDSYWAAVAAQLPPGAQPLLGALRAGVEGGGLPAPPAPDELVAELLAKAREEGPEAALAAVEARCGGRLPDGLRAEASSAAERFMQRIAEKYDEGGVSAAMGALTIGVGATAAFVASDALERAEEQVTAAVDVAEAVASGDLEAIQKLVEKSIFKLPLPLPRPLANLRAGLEVVGQVTGVELPDPEALIRDALKSLTGKLLGGEGEGAGGGAEAALEALAEELDGAVDAVSEAMQGDVAEMADQFMAGLERMLEVDAMALAEALESAYEVLLQILELLNIDEAL